MEYRWLGSTGVRVSVLALGTMGFGGARQGGWVGSIDGVEADRQVGLALDAGINLFDTADVYSAGDSERLLGAALGSRRDEVLVSTKVHGRTGDGQNDVGQSRWHIIRACEASLRRLGTDRIDIYHTHNVDGCTPVEETLRALDDLVRSGKVRYLACSNHGAWQIMKALGAAERLGTSAYAATQIYYSLVGRDVEHEILPLCRDQGLGALVWSPLAGGFLSGKFRPGESPVEGTRRAMIGSLGVGPIDEDRGYAVLEAAGAIAASRGVTVAQVALNWVRSRPEVSAVILGARTSEQLVDNLGAVSWALTGSERATLDELSKIEAPYPLWHQQQFTAERFSPGGEPAGAFRYRFDST